jgi:hypothetical protein
LFLSVFVVAIYNKQALSSGDTYVRNMPMTKHSVDHERLIAGGFLPSGVPWMLSWSTALFTIIARADTFGRYSM